MPALFSLPEPARNRIVRITNVHFDASSSTIEHFFEGYLIQDQYRTINSRSGTKSIAYVLFATAADRVRSCELSGSMLCGREVKIQPAPRGNYECKLLTFQLSGDLVTKQTVNDDQTAFSKPIHTLGKDTATVVGPSDEAPAFGDADFPTLGSAKETKTPTYSTGTLTTDSDVANDAITLCETVFSSILETIALNINEQSVSKGNSGRGTQAKKHNIIAEQKSINVSAEAHDAEHLDIATAQFERPHVQTDVKDDVASETVSKAQTPLLDLNTPHDYIPIPILKAVSRFPPKVASTHITWNLNGHDAYDRSKNIITPNDWYNFRGANQVVKTEQEYMYAGTNFARIMAEISKSGRTSENGRN